MSIFTRIAGCVHVNGGGILWFIKVGCLHSKCGGVHAADFERPVPVNAELEGFLAVESQPLDQLKTYH